LEIKRTGDWGSAVGGLPQTLKDEENRRQNCHQNRAAEGGAEEKAQLVVGNHRTESGKRLGFEENFSVDKKENQRKQKT